MKISSFHTHTRLCRHASGEPIDYVRRAAADGCLALGFSDHCPYPDDAVWPGSRMSVSDLPSYTEMVQSAREESPFPVFWGFECEWYPDFAGWYRDFLRAEIGAEYLVYGSHWVRTRGEFCYIPEVPENRLLKRYVDLTIEGLKSGLYDLFAHPDIFLAGYTHMDDDVRSACAAIIDAAVACDLPMEINGYGLTKSPVQGDAGFRAPYPVAEFWEMAADRGARIVCNSDAHRPQDVLSRAIAAREFAENLGIETIDTAAALGFV